MFRAFLSILLVFTLVSCNGQQVSEANEQQAPVRLSSASPLGQLLSSSTKPAVIKFYAEWCSTCKKYESTFKKVASDMAANIDFYEVNVDDNNYKELLKQLKISRIPETVFVTLDRANVTKKLGAIPRVKLEKLITTQLI